MKVGSGDFTNSCPLTGDNSRCVFGGYFADVDGNGLPDYLSHRSEAGWRSSLPVMAVPHEQPGHFRPTVLERVRDSAPRGAVRPEHQIRITSFDGLDPDLLLWNEAEGKYETLSVAERARAICGPNLPFLKLPENEDRRNLHLADVNCDGLEDAVYPGTGWPSS